MTENSKARGGRPRSGQLIWRKSGRIARLTVLVDGERIEEVSATSCCPVQKRIAVADPWQRGA